MEPHRIERDGTTYDVTFERAPEGWVARIRRTSDGAVHVVAFADGVGYAADDPRGSLIAGCEAAIERLPWGVPTRH
ncbi:hypothetical protein MKK70_05530 [Methylobacterium sp. E-041]|jgi:hypothetical protein|uniref:hypothetical protein n=1 Tax=unclassified Methylobacterium TaxID=2615210 RepID=UPI001FBB1F37|nr:MULTISPECIES: hypothetical protein [unclassified Methylobacterium]MCJ2005781.1 hypothetical protein [Methylobacterium sp. J-092]MCJ2074934.1 hypothetical protein [Methylobacterium sp. E-016]MCJ2104847.1 hypothetical protein [Methylobacterium sp. E-041]MCJ2113182.1 hypothetical protein [Methylobacterium sp. E-025]